MTDKIRDNKELKQSLKDMEMAQHVVAEEKGKITRYLVENDMEEFFSINWKRLRRMVERGHIS